MSEHYFTNGGWRCRRRRSWGRTVVGVLALLALGALTVWLMSCVRHASGAVLFPRQQGCMLAVVPWQEGAVIDLPPYAGPAGIAVLGIGCVMLVAWAVRKMRQHEVEAWDQALTSGGIALCDGPVVPVSADDTVRIVSACAYLAGELRLNATLALTGDEAKLAEIPVTAEKLQGTLLRLKRSLALQSPGAVPEGDEWTAKMGGSGS